MAVACRGEQQQRWRAVHTHAGRRAARCVIHRCWSSSRGVASASFALAALPQDEAASAASSSDHECQPVQLINMQRRQVLMFVGAPLAASASAALVPGEAGASEMAPIDTENKCRECMGIGINPCEEPAMQRPRAAERRLGAPR